MTFLKTLIRDPVTAAGNHRCTPSYEGSVPGGYRRIPLAARMHRADSRYTPALELHGGLQYRRRPAWLMHADNVVSLAAGDRPEQTRAISWGGERIGHL